MLNNKMKKAGYLCYAFAAVLSVLGLFDIGEPSVVLPLVSTWLTAGTSLLIGNAAKRIVGAKTKERK